MEPRKHRTGKILLVVAGLVLSLLVSGCEGPAGDGEGPGHREQKLALSSRQELELGQQAYKEVLSDPEKYGRVLPSNSPETQRVRKVAGKLIQASEIKPLRREINLREGYRMEWEENVLDNPQVNAFCLPGGKIVVFLGILRVTRDDAQLATVLAHEIAHALAHHASERVAREQINSGIGGGFWSKAYDRAQESEADHIGLFLMTFAGYDPDEAVQFWQRMQQLSGQHGSLPEILSDHPSDARRIKDLEQWVSKAKAAKRAYDEGKIAPEPRR
jgi:predicted Zn-dependent protease